VRGPLLDVEDLSRVVAQAREPEADEAVADRERGEAVADGEVERALRARRLREDALAHVGVVLARVDERPELGGGDRHEGRAGRRDERVETARDRCPDLRQTRIHVADPAMRV
jgi:hypothetical protein